MCIWLPDWKAKAAAAQRSWYGDPQLLLYTNPKSNRLSCPVTTDNIDIDCWSLYKSS